MSEEMARTEAIEVLKDIISKPILYSNHIIGACRVALASLETDEAYQLEYERTTKNDLAVEKTDMIDKSNFSQEQYKTDLQSAYDCGYAQAKNDLGVDAVSRQAINGYIDYILSHGMGKKKSFDFIKKFVTNLPPTTSQETRWIPTSVRKPEKGGEYLLWGKICEDEDDNYCFIGDYHEFDEVFGTEISNYDPKTLGFIDTEIEEYYSVVAWMPLPTDYSEVEE